MRPAFKIQDWIRSLFGEKKRSRRGTATKRQRTSAQISRTTISEGQASTLGETRPADAGATAPIRSAAAATQRAAVSEDNIPQEWKPGDVLLDLYAVMGVLGEGGMGKVYRVHHKGWNIDLAVKSPQPDVLAQAGGTEGFVRECEAWVNLGLHPHVVSCHYVRTLGGIPRVFAELVDGGSLSDWIRSRKLYEGGPQKALERILDVAIQVAWGLDYAHEQGLVHQDVKPANVMMTSDGLAKVTDFGLAQARARVAQTAAAASPGHSVVVPGWGLMTPEYCSPEQARREPLTRKTDIWSWGLSVLEMFNGELSWRAGQAAPEVLQGYLDARADDAFLPRMPQEIAELLARCFAEAPAARPKSLKEIAGSLQESYRIAADRPYSRTRPNAAELGADSLNNRALSFLDLGKSDQADSAWQAALAADKQHPEATFNRGLVLWRQEKLTDKEFVGQLETVRATVGDSWVMKYLLALVHLERGNVDIALPLLQAAAQQAPAERELQKTLELARSGAMVPGRHVRTFKGHTNSVRSVYLSADCRLALSGAEDMTLRLWEVATGRCLRVFEGHVEQVNSVCLSADARYALSGSGNTYGHASRTSKYPSLRLWEVSTGHCLRTLTGHTDAVLSVCFSADTSFAVSGSSDMTLRSWDLATGRCLRVFKGHTESVRSVCLSADSRLALSGSNDKTLRVWELSTGRCLRTLEGNRGDPGSVSLSADGRYALSKDVSYASLWDVATGQRVHSFGPVVDFVESVCLSADGHLALAGASGSAVRGNSLYLWEAVSGRCLHKFEGHEYGVTSMHLSPDGRFALSGSRDHTVRLWQIPKGSVAPVQLSRIWSYSQLAEADTRVRALVDKAEAALEENRLAAALGLLRTARALPGKERLPKLLEAWNKLALQSRRGDLRGAWLVTPLEGHTASVYCVCLSADARLGLSGSVDNSLRAWDIATRQCLRTFQGHTNAVTSVCMSGDARKALSGSWDNSMRLWEVATGQCLRTLQGHSDFVLSVCLSADRRFALSGSRDKTVRLWDVATGRCLRTLAGHAGYVRSVCLSPDSRHALSGSDDKTLRLWEIATGKCLRILEGHGASVGAVCLSVDAREALSGGWDRTLRLWDTATGRCLQKFEGHTGDVTSVSLSADGRYALSGSRDKTLRLWAVTDGRCVRTLEGHTGNVQSVCLSANASSAVSGGEDKALRVWSLDWELEPRDTVDWDEGARPYLQSFLASHTPYAGVLPGNRDHAEEEIERALTRRGEPSWTEAHFEDLLYTLGCAGYGWLRPEGVRAALQHTARDWKGPPSLPRAQ